LKQVLLNLLSNAVKYNNPYGELTVAVDNLDQQHIRIQIRDTGRGLTQEQISHLFEPFNRLGLNREGPDAVEGTGLGLVVAKQLIDLMGGRMGVSSSPGAGSSFWVDLVCDRARPELEPTDAIVLPPEPAPAQRGHSTVLLVDDDRPSHELVQAQLSRRQDLKLVTASNGREGVALAIAHRPAVILMDNSMPELTGRQALELLSQDPRTANIPVIAISASAHILAGTDDSASWFSRVAKPFDRDDLLQAIDAAIRRP